MTKHDWIVAHDSTAGEDAMAMECLRCGEKQRFKLPIAITVWCAAAKAFEKLHAKCQEKTDSKINQVDKGRTQPGSSRPTGSVGKADRVPAKTGRTA